MNVFHTGNRKSLFARSFMLNSFDCQNRIAVHVLSCIKLPDVTMSIWCLPLVFTFGVYHVAFKDGAFGHIEL